MVVDKMEHGRPRRVCGSQKAHSVDEDAGGGRRFETCEGRTPSLLETAPGNVSADKLWKFRRNLVIFVAHREGIPQRILADVFDLPKSRVSTIIKEFKNLAIRKNDQSFKSTHPPRDWTQ
jgi:hypothetical protein